MIKQDFDPLRDLRQAETDIDQLQTQMLECVTLMKCAAQAIEALHKRLERLERTTNDKNSQP